MLERHQVLRHAGLSRGLRVLEVGSGGHAITTVPLALEVGSEGKVVAVERSRWGIFQDVVDASGLAERVRPLKADALALPLRHDSHDLAVCAHGIRSLESLENMVAVFREMLRVAPRVLVAESLPLAQNDAQRAHLETYNLREEIFEAATGRKDDLHYLPLETLEGLVRKAGGEVERAETLEVDLPHALAYLPRDALSSISDRPKRERLLVRWEKAREMGERFGTDHPPVGLVLARRKAAERGAASGRPGRHAAGTERPHHR
ncbi:MAG: class I SAM-dependent methyltransferase [Euryarchaeota archaeon]|nr:class I SAM-dependent methyltransferase [Euryarchaeota archaeon]MDE2045655.1 class I SAM-dependent methyltransferase [Thermoplasmata archaeon]